MKTERKVLFFIVIFYALIFIGIFVFYAANPFDNECVSGSCWNDQGIYIYTSGIKYKGDWKYGRRHGAGTIIYPDGRRYEGHWENNKIHGQGTLTAPNGFKYEGEWENGKKHGKGTMQYPRSKYEGYWRNGKRNGKGKMIFSDGSVWTGEWKDDMIYNGEGVFIERPYLRYDGYWRNGILISGKVTITNPDGSKSISDVKNGKKVDKGLS